MMIAHLWQSTLFALAVGLLTLAFRQNAARIRHALWLAASVKFLLPFSLMVAIGHQIRLPESAHATVIVQQATRFAIPDFLSVPDVETPLISGARAARDWTPEILFIIWICGAGFVMLR